MFFFLLFLKNQYEQQIKDLRKQIKQITEEKQQEFENLSKQLSEFQDEIHSLKQQIDEANNDKVREKDFKVTDEVFIDFRKDKLMNCRLSEMNISLLINN